MNQKRIVNKIDAIKTLRQFCIDTWGHSCGLKIAKDAVENIMSQQTVTLSLEQISRILYAANDWDTQQAISHIIDEETF